MHGKRKLCARKKLKQIKDRNNYCYLQAFVIKVRHSLQVNVVSIKFIGRVPAYQYLVWRPSTTNRTLICQVGRFSYITIIYPFPFFAFFFFNGLFLFRPQSCHFVVTFRVVTLDAFLYHVVIIPSSS